jgi:hypothetical protein
MFVAFLLRGLSLPVHEFLRGLLFVYGMQLHDLTPNMILHIACFVTLCECFLGVEPHWALWKRIFSVKRERNCQVGGFGCRVRPDVQYIDIRMPENNPGWRTKWFYAKDQPKEGQEFGLEPFRAVSDLRPRKSWEHEMSEAEMKITEPLMEKIQALRSDAGREVTGFQLIRLFLERRVQPLAARPRRMWEYTGKKDSMRLCSEDLKEAEVDAKMKSITSLTKNQDVPKRFEKEPFSANLARTEVLSFPLASTNFFFRVVCLIDSLS